MKKRIRFRIRTKIILLTAILAVLLASVAMIFFGIVINNNNNRQYKSIATSLSNTVAATIDVQKVKNVVNDVMSFYDPKFTRENENEEGYAEYLAKFDEVRNTQDYKDLQAFLYNVKTHNTDADAVYLGAVDYERKLCIYIVYDEESEIYPTGVIDPLYEEDYPLVNDHKLGFVASIYNEPNEGIYLVTAGAPIVDESDEVICYALVDIEMRVVRARQNSSIIRLLVYLSVMVVIIIVTGVLFANFVLIKPLRQLIKTASSYDKENPEAAHEAFTNLNVKTTDEIYDLAESMKKMESDINRKITELTTLNEELQKSQQVAYEMSELANKDGLTGVRNKVAYNEEVKKLNEKIANKEPVAFGIAMVDLNDLKKTNDESGHNAGDVALIKLTNIICATFAHSPVFRVGGDEFVIILFNTDYKRAKRLILEFNLKIEELQEDEYLPEFEKVSAAIGYSRFNPETDKCVEDVFARADEIMYEHKREMKKK